ncbi:MAG: hypothetical protein AAB455_00800 [Patescibacteria group bacterium]
MSLIEVNKKHGVVLLYAILLVSIVLTISLSLLNITYKQLILTAVSRESQVAHFTALSALDCAYFTDRFYKDNTGNDTNVNPFGQVTITESGVSFGGTGNPDSAFSCGSGQITKLAVVTAPNHVAGSPDYVISRYNLTGAGLIGSCATVEVVKVVSGDYGDYGEGAGVSDAGKVISTAYGYNTCSNNSSRLVERRARVRQ